MPQEMRLEMCVCVCARARTIPKNLICYQSHPTFGHIRSYVVTVKLSEHREGRKGVWSDTQLCSICVFQRDPYLQDRVVL